MSRGPNNAMGASISNGPTALWRQWPWARPVTFWDHVEGRTPA
jgi:hypothetical protein